MGGTDAERPGITARSKPPLPPKPALTAKPNGIASPPLQSFDKVLPSENVDRNMVVEESETLAKQNETEDCRMHDIEIHPVADSMEHSVSRSGAIERNVPKSESSSVNNSLPSSLMSATSSDKTNTRRTATRGRPPRRTSRHSIENGESGDEACCIRFAGMLRTKAVDMASKSKILPPAKPPKPDTLVKPKGRRRKGSQQNVITCHHSIGDDLSIDGSRHGVRFVDDDETESSTDYKDFEENNSVFLLEFACHCDSQNISRGTGFLSEGVESGYYTSDIVKTDEETNLSDINQQVDTSNDKDETIKPKISLSADQITVSQMDTSFTHSIEEENIAESFQEDGKVLAKDKENETILSSDEGLPLSSEVSLDIETSMIINSSGSLIPSNHSFENKVEDTTLESKVSKHETDVNKDNKNDTIPTSGVIDTEISPIVMEGSVPKPKRVTSPPRPPPPKIAKKPLQVIAATEESEKCIVTKEELVPDEKALIEEPKKEEEETTVLIDSVQSEENIPVPEVPPTKKRVTSPPRPPPPKIKETIMDEEVSSVPPLVKVDDKIEIKETSDDMLNRNEDIKQDDGVLNKKQPPPVPSKPLRRRKEIVREKSSLEPLDLSTKDDVGQCAKPLSLSPKTFPRSGRPRTMASSVRKTEFPSQLKPREQTLSKEKPIMTTVVRNTYLEGLQPLSLIKSSSETKQLPTRPPPPKLAKPVETPPPCVDTGEDLKSTQFQETSDDIPEAVKSLNAMSSTDKDEIIENKENSYVKDQCDRPPPPKLAKPVEMPPPCVDTGEDLRSTQFQETSDDIPEAVKSLNAMPNTDKDEIIENEDSYVKDQCDESLATTHDSSDNAQEAAVPATELRLEDNQTTNELDNNIATDTFVRDEIQSSTWPIAAERKKRKEMKSPLRPPPPLPPGHLCLNKDNIKSGADSSVLSKDSFPRQTYETSSLDSRGRKRINSPPRPPPPQINKLPMKIEEEPLSFTLRDLKEETSCAALDKNDAKHVKSPPPEDQEDQEPSPLPENKKRVISPPRPPPPVYEKLPLRRTNKPVVFSSTTPQQQTRPPPPTYEKVHFKQITIDQDVSKQPETKKIPSVDTMSKELLKSPPSLCEIVQSKTKESMIHVPLATEENVTEDQEPSPPPENKKRVISPPRPPPPVHEKLPLRRTNKPVVFSSTTPRTNNMKETSDSHKVQFFSLRKTPTASHQQLPPGSAMLHEYEEIQPPDEEHLVSEITRPKVPPRVKRNRSKTVEVVAVTEKPEERKRRSHSLSESDVLKKLEDRGLLPTPQHSELKMLYTTVQKERGKMKLQELNVSEDGRRTPGYDKMKLRPLPPPPPPPRCRSRTSMSQSPAGTCRGTFVSEEVKLESIRSTCTETEQTVNETEVLEYDENANISAPLAKVDEEKKQKETTKGKCQVEEEQVQINEFHPNKPVAMRGKSRTPPSTRSKSPSPSKHRSASSWYDESDGDLGDVDTSSSLKGSAEAINKDDADESTEQKQKHGKQKSDQRRTSTFYCDFEDDAFHDCATEFSITETERPVSSSSLVEKSVQTSPERELGLNGQEKNNHSDDTDDLLDRARTVQMELCLMLERRKRKKCLSHGAEDDTKSSCSYTPSPKSTIPRHKDKITSELPVPDQVRNVESPLIVSPVENRQTLSSTRSSNSELCWQVLTSDESDEEAIEASSSLLQKKKQKKAFQIANEIMTSEETFISALKLLNEDFRGAIDKANKERGGTVISEEVINSFLRYFPQLQHLNENLLSELKERIDHWDDTGKIADIIVKIGPFLKLYSSYIRDFDAMEAALQDARRKYPLFDQVTKDFESGPRCKKLALKHYMLKPIQRIPLYRLLLQEYLHNLTPDSPDYNDTLTALQIVSEVADHANETLRQGDNFQKLISIQNSLFGQQEVVRPGRVFLKEGELMKLSRKDMQPRWFILFNDSLLYLTSMQQGLFKVNNELPLAGMKVHIPQHQDYQNEFSVISVARSFTLSARSLEERQEWIDALNKAIEENASKRSSFAAVMMQQQQKGKDEEVDSSFVLGKQAPVWIPDARVTMCQLCTSEFTVTFRRHHCRACGKVVCSLCSANIAPLQYRNFSVARVCDECFEKLQKEFEATDQVEKVTEESGSCSEVGETDSDSPHAMANIKAQFKGNARNVGKKNKRQLPSVLKEVCANDQGSTISGYLQKRYRKCWKRFWFVLKDKVLYTYKASEDIAALESVPLLGFIVEIFTKPFEGIEAELLFQLTHPGQFPIIFHADNAASAERWIQDMKNATILE